MVQNRIFARYTLAGKGISYGYAEYNPSDAVEAGCIEDNAQQLTLGPEMELIG